ncbi:hypothetical protein H6F77_00140 [Microcoleus sp. FACHB-831]|uniref:hypothetical protein n=1 Tax=Microcoleus sp. FACHB-831 TaxID=2692827 RepID=UPI001683A7E2|nr:hypothetical protein [Microcoleus sp. FACHB-831]MBD1919533.1 hypothetical protein [Microcoleus sp. FACHB-831]
MRLSQMLFVTLREDAAEAKIPSHKLLLRAGWLARWNSGCGWSLPPEGDCHDLGDDWSYIALASSRMRSRL